LTTSGDSGKSENEALNQNYLSSPKLSESMYLSIGMKIPSLRKYCGVKFLLLFFSLLAIADMYAQEISFSEKNAPLDRIFSYFYRKKRLR
jgi:hypothetical protein